MKATHITILCLVSLMTISSLAQEHPFDKKGPTKDHLSSLDSVNPKNGNGFIRIPIGQAFQIGGNFEFQLTLNYNSKIWEHISGNYNDGPFDNYVTAFPSRKSTAGVGWTLNIGKLTPPGGLSNGSGKWKFTDPNGSEHLFFDTLHQGGPGQAGSKFSRTGSYLRFREVSGGEHVVEYPNGMTYRFGADHKLVRIYDAQGPDTNYLAVTYSGTTQILQDQHGRTWKLFFQDFVLPSGLYLPSYSAAERTIQILNGVEMPGYGGHPITWGFEYITLANGQYPSIGLGCAVANGPPLLATPLPLLGKVILPDADPDDLIPPTFYMMDYYYDDSLQGCKHGALNTLVLPTGGRIEWDYKEMVLPAHCQPDPGSNPTPFLWGRSNWITNRTYYDIDDRKLAEWQYSYHLSTPPGKGGDHCPGNEPHDFAPEVLVTVETNPLGDRLIRAFNIWPQMFESEHGYSALNHGMDVLRDPALGTGSMLSLDSAIDPIPAIDPADPNPEGSKRLLSEVYYRKQGSVYKAYSATYVRYEADAPSLSGGPLAVDFNDFDRNLRVRSSRIHYFHQTQQGPRPATITTYYSKFDGLGNFRETRTFGFPAAGRSQPGFDPLDEASLSKKTDTQNTNPGVPALELDTNLLPISWTMPPFSERWVLHRFDEKTVYIPGGGTEKSTFEFDDRGLMTEKRVFKSGGMTPSPSDQDLLFHYTYDDGQLMEIKVFGGDRTPIPDPFNPDADPPQWHRKTTFTYDETSKARLTEIQHAPDGRTLVKYTKTADANTGLITSEADTTGILTTYEFDDLGRKTGIQTPPETATQILFKDADPSSDPVERAKSTLFRGPFENPDEMQEMEADGFGRNLFERVWFENGKVAITEYQYGSNGYLAKVSTPYIETSQRRWTTYENYHPTGVALKTSLPDGSDHFLEIIANEVFRESSKIALDKDLRVGEDFILEDGSSYESPNPEEWPEEVRIKRNMWKDFLGRVRRVEERSQEGSDSVVVTTNVYDSGNRLKEATTRHPVASLEQQREFDYDKRGFKTSETHPEQTGQLTYTGFDTFGNASVIQGQGLQMSKTYDAFGRLTQVFDDRTGRPLEEFSYAASNDGGNMVAGKLVQVKRHNYLPSPAYPQRNVVVTQTYRFEHQRGRISAIHTKVDDRVTPDSSGLRGTYAFVQRFEYDTLGRMEDYQMPQQARDWMGTDGARTLHQDWQFANLKTISTDYGGSQSPLIQLGQYTAHGVPLTLDFINGVSRKQLLDPSRTGRPGSIWTEGVDAGENWSSGDYIYDSSGNITQIGGDRFWYDHVNRLTFAKITGLEETFRYDRYGNITAINCEDTLVHAADNRITKPGVRYDQRGNLIENFGTNLYYDPSDMVYEVSRANEKTQYAYGPNHERIMALNIRDGHQFLTVRDENHQVVKEYAKTAGSPLLATKAYVYAGKTGWGTYDMLQDRWLFHVPDHLGSVRLITGENREKVAGHRYLAFGTHLPDGDNVIQDTRILFSGHEKDSSQRYYMHRRYFNPALGRFYSPDPVLGNLELPQTWNRYSYGLNNPLRMVDRDGQYGIDFHRDVTFLIARLAGFNKAEALEIGNQTRMVDVRHETKPVALRTLRDHNNVLRNFHFTTEKRREALFINAINSTGSFRKLGEFLHAVQDSFSHQKSPDEGTGEPYKPPAGHLFDGKAPDKVINRQELALKAANATYQAIQLYRHTRGMGIDDNPNFFEFQELFVELFKYKPDTPEYGKAFEKILVFIDGL